jgi:hypothetical protein
VKEIPPTRLGRRDFKAVDSYLRLQTVWSAEQEANFTDVWLVQEQHQNAKQAHTETTVGRRSILEEVKVGLKAFWL